MIDVLMPIILGESIEHVVDVVRCFSLWMTIAYSLLHCFSLDGVLSSYQLYTGISKSSAPLDWHQTNDEDRDLLSLDLGEAESFSLLRPYL